MIDIRDHGTGSSGSSSSLTTSLKYTVSTTSPSSPNKGDLWIKTSSSYSNVSICKNIPTSPDSNTIYILVLGVYGIINTTKLNVQLNNGCNNSGTIEFNVNFPNSNNISFMTTKILKQGSDISWYGSPYKVYLGNTEIESYSYNGSDWSKIGYVFYFYCDNYPNSAIYEYRLGNNSISKLVDVDSVKKGYYRLDTSPYSSISVTYDKLNNKMWYNSSNDAENRGASFDFKSGFSSFSTSDYSLSRYIIDNSRGYVYYLGSQYYSYPPNGGLIKVRKLTTNEVVTTVPFPLNGVKGTDEAYPIELVLKGDKLWIYGYKYSSSVSMHVLGYMILDGSWQYTSVQANNVTTTNANLTGIILDSPVGSNSVYVVQAVANDYDNGNNIKDTVLYRYDLGGKRAYSSIQTLSNSVSNYPSEKQGNYVQLNETSTKVYFAYENRGAMAPSYFSYDKINHTIMQLPNLNNIISKDCFKTMLYRTNSFTEGSMMFSIKDGNIYYSDIETGTIYNIFNLSSSISNTTKLYPLFASSGAVS